MSNYALSIKLISEMPKITKFKKAATNERYLTDGEEDALLAYLDQNYSMPAACARISLQQGLRVSEVINLRPRNVVWETNKLHLYSTENKAGKSRAAPMTDEMRRILKAWEGKGRYFNIE